jgi:hypothetical protein
MHSMHDISIIIDRQWEMGIPYQFDNRNGFVHLSVLIQDLHENIMLH